MLPAMVLDHADVMVLGKLCASISFIRRKIVKNCE